MELIIMRHGQTAGNLKRHYIGTTDEPLCEEGMVCALSSYRDDSVEVVFVSPLKRARMTATLCFPNARQVVVDDLREMDFGSFEGKSYKDMEDDPAYREWVDGWCRGRCPGGEDWEEVQTRTCDAIADILTDTDSDRVVIVAHGGTVMAAMDYFCDDTREYYEWRVNNCCGYRCQVEFDHNGTPVFTNPALLGPRGEE